MADQASQDVEALRPQWNFVSVAMKRASPKIELEPVELKAACGLHLWIGLRQELPAVFNGIQLFSNRSQDLEPLPAPS